MIPEHHKENYTALITYNGESNLSFMVEMLEFTRKWMEDNGYDTETSLIVPNTNGWTILAKKTR
jgi:hypothetical protein